MLSPDTFQSSPDVHAPSNRPLRYGEGTVAIHLERGIRAHRVEGHSGNGVSAPCECPDVIAELPAAVQIIRTMVGIGYILARAAQGGVADGDAIETDLDSRDRSTVFVVSRPSGDEQTAILRNIGRAIHRILHVLQPPERRLI